MMLGVPRLAQARVEDRLRLAAGHRPSILALPVVVNRNAQPEEEESSPGLRRLLPQRHRHEPDRGGDEEERHPRVARARGTAASASGIVRRSTMTLAPPSAKKIQSVKTTYEIRFSKVPQNRMSTAAHSDCRTIAKAGVWNRGWISATFRKNSAVGRHRVVDARGGERVDADHAERRDEDRDRDQAAADRAEHGADGVGRDARRRRHLSRRQQPHVGEVRRAGRWR